MKQPKFRHPKEMPKDVKVPLSTRVKESTKDALEAAAKKHGLTLAEVAANVLDDYADWLQSNSKAR